MTGVLLLAACGGTSTLRVASSGDYPPFSAATPYGALVGFDAVAAAQFARDTGRPMEFVPLRWPQLAAQAETGSFDVAMSGVTIRGDRVGYLLFSRPYAVAGAVVAVRRERAAALATLDDIDRPGIRIAVNRGGHLERVARSRFVHATVLTIDDNRSIADRVLRGEVDAAVTDQLEVAAWPPETFAVIGPFTRDRKAYAVAPGREALLNELNHWLAERERDGWLNDQRRRWLSETTDWSPEDACFEAIAADIDLRLLLMPEIAKAKRRLGLAIEDPAREAVVLEQVARWAAEDGIGSAAVVALFERLIDVAKEVQRRAAESSDRIGLPRDLERLRAAAAFYSRSLVRELAQCRPALLRADAEARVAAALHQGEAFRANSSLPVGELASLIARLQLDAPAPAALLGAHLETCIPPHRRFDLEGYTIEITAEDGQVLRHPVPSGHTPVSVKPGRYGVRVYVNGSSADPRRGGAASRAPLVPVQVAEDQSVTVRYTPAFSDSGRFELHWQDVYGAAVGELDRYRGLTHFDAETVVDDPVASGAASRCPW